MKRKILGIPISLFLIGLLVVGGATAALIAAFGTIIQAADVEQGLKVDGHSYKEPVNDEIAGIYSSTGGYSLITHTLTNDAPDDAEVFLQRTACAASDSPHSCDEIQTKFYKYEEYETMVNIDGYSIPATVTVEDLGASLKWTIDMDETDSDLSYNHAGYGLVISLDGVKPAFQVHGNDGTDSTYPYGTHLYSEYDNGWHTGDTNTPIDTMSTISASGERDLAVNTDAVFEVEIDKSLLDKKFYWSLALMGNTVDTKYPDTWNKWSGDASGMAEATLMTEVSSIIVPANGSIDYMIENVFPPGTIPAKYTITSEVTI